MKTLDKKLFFNLVFMMVGTFILVTMGIIVAGNFIKDSRLLHPGSAAVAVVETPKPKATMTPEPETTNKESTFNYKRKPDAVAPKVDYGESMPKGSPSPSPAPANTPKGIKVEVINYTGVKNLAEEMRTLLEANGYTVSAGNAVSSKPVATTIIEWNDKKAGSELQKLLKAGKIVRTPDPSSRFDVTLQIGDDFKP